ncbi:unnamed protein product [marine sediment metagenome]|uniref:Uncharacterized protein n=1 Tax=marine sediment metagenome TaxID=412755 RepID=X1MHF6_9ZZZZ
MPGHESPAGKTQIDPGSLYQLGGQTLTMDGTSQALTIPSSASIIEIDAEDEKVYYNLGGGIASALSPGYVPKDNGRFIGPLANLSAVTIFGVAGGYAHIQYFRFA